MVYSLSAAPCCSAAGSCGPDCLCKGCIDYDNGEEKLGLYRISGRPDIRPFNIRYSAGYPVLLNEYLAGRITGYLVKLLNK